MTENYANPSGAGQPRERSRRQTTIPDDPRGETDRPAEPWSSHRSLLALQRNPNHSEVTRGSGILAIDQAGKKTFCDESTDRAHTAVRDQKVNVM